MTSLVLASASPRRRELLQQIGLKFKVVVTDVDESLRPNEVPHAYVGRLAKDKAKAGYSPGNITLGADTVVVVDGDILTKPAHAADAVSMLARLSGRTHQVLTGVAAYDGARLECTVVSSSVTFREILPAEAAAYVDTTEPMDKAGGYGIQGIGGIFVSQIEGSYSAVVGLPLEQTEQLLQKLDYDTWSARING